MTDTVYNDPYDPQGASTGGETPLLDKVLQDAIDAALIETHTCMPGQIAQVKSSTKVDVQPLLQRKYKDGTLVTLPIIQDVPVCFPSGATWWVKCPIAVGDTGIIFFAERSLDKWLAGGGLIDPADPRKHDLSDAMFYPGLKPFSQSVPGDPTDLILHNKVAEIQMKSSGKYLIKGASSELIDLISQLADLCSQIANAGGPTFNAAQFTALKILIDGMKG